ncbi:MAG: hypothetical protein V1820_04720 [archaeon]
MRRGILFSIVFFLLFLLLLSAAILYSDYFRASAQNRAAGRRVFKEGYYADNAASNVAAFLNLSISGNRSAGETTISFSDSMHPIDSDLAKYKDFLEGKILPLANLDGTLEISDFISNPRVFSGAANYSWNSLSKNSSNLSLSSAPLSEKIEITFTGENDTDDSGWNWLSCSSSCGAGEFFLELDIANSTGTQIVPDGCSYGCLSASATNTLVMNGTGEPFILAVGGSYSFVSAKPGALLEIVRNVTLGTPEELAFEAPISLQVSGRSNFSTLILTRI